MLLVIKKDHHDKEYYATLDSVRVKMIRKAKKGIRNPRSAAAYVYRLIHGKSHHELQKLNQWYHKRMSNHEGYNLLEASWDTAIILDACRYDTFEEHNRYDSTLQQKTAVGSESREFFQKTFKDDTFHDTVYVTGNPYITILEKNTFYDVYLDQAWNTAGTAADPDRVTDAAIQAHNSHPNKRIIVHYMQPHLPIVAPEWQQINQHIMYYGGDYFPSGEISRKVLYEAYEANLQYVLDYVDRLLDEIQGRVLLTSDHGELMGERQSPIPIRGFNHQESLYVDGLTQVPWLEMENGPRREIKDENPVGEINVSEQDRREQLESLGYL